MSDLDTLRRKVAELAGYHVRPVDDDDDPAVTAGYAVFAPDGERVDLSDALYRYEPGTTDDDLIALAWQRALRHKPPLVPDYPRDANAWLPLDSGVVIDMEELWNGQAMAQVVITVTGKQFPWCKGETLAEARARAWLAWRKDKGER